MHVEKGLSLVYFQDIFSNVIFFLHPVFVPFLFPNTVRATPKSNTVDNVRALQGDATVLE